ncbi:hypothetical protein CHU98_g12376, partial [Xylaria longipes]
IGKATKVVHNKTVLRDLISVTIVAEKGILVETVLNLEKEGFKKQKRFQKEMSPIIMRNKIVPIPLDPIHLIQGMNIPIRIRETIIRLGSGYMFRAESFTFRPNCVARGITRKFRRACTAINRDDDLKSSPLLLSQTTLKDQGIILDPGTNQWYFGLRAPNFKLLSANKFARACRNEKCCQALIQLPEPVWLEELSSSQNQSNSAIITERFPHLKEFFQYEKASILPHSSRGDLAIELEENTTPPHYPIYPLAQDELEELRKWLAEMIKNGKIRKSKSPAGAPILFVPKKDGTLRLCVDYRGLNHITVKNRFTLPLISEMLDRIAHAKVFSKIDLKDAYYRLRIRTGDEWKTAFRTRYGHYEFLVMPMGLCNAPATFQNYIQEALDDILDTFCIAFLDDVLIFSMDTEAHTNHVRDVIERLQKADLYAKPSKCQFYKDKIEFLGYVISGDGIEMDPDRIRTIQDWCFPGSCHELQQFLGFCNFYRRFIEGFSQIVAPLTRYLKKDASGVKEGRILPNSPAVEAFEQLQDSFGKAILLTHFDPEKQILVETDASSAALAGSLSQRDPQGRWRPVSFYSRKFTEQESRYGTPDQEMLAIVECFKHWRHYLQGSKVPVEVLTDHSNLQAFMKTSKLNGRQARWCIYLAPFDFTIRYRPGKRNRVDAASRRPDYMNGTRSDANLLPTIERKIAVAQIKAQDELPRILVGEVFAACSLRKRAILAQAVTRHRARITTCDENSWAQDISKSLQELIEEIQGRDPECRGLMKRINRGLPTEQQWSKSGPLLLYNRKVYIPSEKSLHFQIIELYHDDALAGHFGEHRTQELVERKFYWQHLRKDVQDYVKGCAICLGAKAKHHREYGELNPLPIPSAPMRELSMDFITGFPPTFYKGKMVDSIFVIVDRFTKMTLLFPVSTTITATELAVLFHQEVECKYGSPTGIVSDRGPVFTSKFWSHLCYYTKIKQRLSVAFHPRTDGQTERMNQTIEAYLRCFASTEEMNWPQLLPQAYFAMNSAMNSTINEIPFKALMGYIPEFRLFVEDNFTLKGVPAVQARIKRLKTIREALAEQWRSVSEKYTGYYNTKHKPTEYKVDQLVVLSTKNLRFKCRKLAPKFVGPFRVAGRVGSQAYRLSLPTKYDRLHNVFPVQLLEPWNSTSDQKIPLPDLENTDDEWELEDIVGKMTYEDQLYYEVKWKDWPTEYNQWVLATDITAPKAVKTFEKRENSHKKQGKRRKTA